MKIKLSTFLAALICCFAFPALSKAEMTITWDGSVLSGAQIYDAGSSSPYPSSFSNDGITLTANYGSTTASPYSSYMSFDGGTMTDSDPDYGADFTFSCATANITRIEMTCSSAQYSYQITASGWSLTSSDYVIVWTGSASSVNFGKRASNVTQIVFTTDEVIAPDKLSGVFSISPCTTVQFSKGNLQYKASNDSWRFANKQYEIIGANPGNTTDSYSRNTQAAWIDLFGWGTGDQPWKASGDYSSYTEWGEQFDAENGWRTLTYDEWMYLLGGRYDYDPYYNPNPGVSYAMGTVNGVGGLILLPDDWNTSYYMLSNPNPPTHSPYDYYPASYGSYSDNVITLSDWTTYLEAHGAVFLPATGYRNTYSSNPVDGVTELGNYWTATPDQYGYSAYCLVFSDSEFQLYTSDRNLGFAVRLVSTYQTKPDASVSVTPTTRTGLVYNGSWQALVNTGEANGGRLLFSEYSSSLEMGSEYSPTEKNAGTYTIYYMVQGDDEHCDFVPSSNSISVTIAKANSSITLTPTPITGLEYTGSAQTLINAGSATGGTMQYKLGSGSWGTSLPQATDAGTYTIYYKVAQNTNYNEFNDGSYINVTIAPKTNYEEEDANIETCLAILTDPTDLTINRTVYKDGYYNTICLPVDMSAVEIAASDLAGCELYAFDDASVIGNVLELNIYPESAIEAGVPYLIKWPNTSTDAQDITLTFSDITIGATAGTRVGDGSVQFVGTIGRTDLPVDEDYLFVGANNTLYWSNNDGTTMKAFRAYFIVGEDSVISPRQTPARLVVRPKAPTGIGSIMHSEIGVQKVLRDGMLYIIKNNTIYNAQGQIVK